MDALREWMESDLDVIMVGTWMLCGNGWGLIWTLSWLAHGRSVRGKLKKHRVPRGFRLPHHAPKARATCTLYIIFWCSFLLKCVVWDGPKSSSLRWHPLPTSVSRSVAALDESMDVTSQVDVLKRRELA